MKRIISVTLLAIFGTTLLAGCASEVANCTSDQKSETYGQYEILICGYADSITEVCHEIEYEFADKEKYDTIKPEESLEFTLNNEKKFVEYIPSSPEYREVNYFSEYKYKDSAGNEYWFDDKEMLTRYWNCNVSKEGKIVTQEECAEIARNFVKGIIDTSEYRCSVKTEEWLGEKRYYVLFSKYIGEIETTDHAEVYLNLNGEITSYSGFMLNRISLKTSIADIDLNAVAEALRQKLDITYEKAKGNYDRVEYSEPDFQLTVLKNGQRGLFTYVEVRCVNNVGECETHMNELLKIVIPLP